MWPYLGFFNLALLTIAATNSVFAMAGYSVISKFSPAYLALYLNGQGLASVLTACLQLLSLSVGVTKEGSAFIYFGCGILINALTLILLMVAVRHPLYRYKMKDFQDNQKGRMISFREAQIVTKKIWPSIAIMGLWTLTYNPVHPSVTALVVSQDEGRNEWGGAQNYQGLSDLDILPEGKPPTFVTPGQTYRIAAGSTVVLPCRITPSGSYVLAWKRGIAVLTAGPIKVTPDPRVRLLTPSPVSTSSLPGIPELSGGGYSLELKDVRPQDAGDYVCQIGTMEPREITHTLEILVPPRIHYVSHSGPLEVLQGATVKMECRASGNPVPTMAWTRKNNVLPSGERSVSGLSLVIQHADRHSAGQYQCSADNGVGQPDTRHITLNVLYGPEVETERASVHTGIGLEAQLVCIVHAEPAPQVLWYKDTAQLGTTEQHAAHARGNRYTLVIRNVTSQDFGNYSCAASNTHGKGRGQLTLTGTAGLAVFDSTALGTEKDSYNISWSVNSHAAITEYRLFYRQQPRHHHGHHQEANSTKLGYRSDWNSVVLPGPGVNNFQFPAPPPYPGVTRQRMSYIVKSLQSATTYEARVQAKNQHGWNKLSPIFHFTTRSNDMENMVEPSAQPAVYGVSQQGMAHFSSGVRTRIISTFCVFITLVVQFF